MVLYSTLAQFVGIAKVLGMVQNVELLFKNSRREKGKPNQYLFHTQVILIPLFPFPFAICISDTFELAAVICIPQFNLLFPYEQSNHWILRTSLMESN